MKTFQPMVAIRLQKGVSFVVVMIVLVVMTLLGLAAIRSTLLRERMSANMYDRSLAFQSAESALREAELAVRQAVLAGTPIGTDCSAVVPPVRFRQPGRMPAVAQAGPQVLQPKAWLQVRHSTSSSSWVSETAPMS